MLASRLAKRIQSGRLGAYLAYLLVAAIAVLALVCGDDLNIHTGRHPAAGEGKVHTPMRLHGSAARLTILVDKADLWHHKPLYVEIVHRAHRAGLAGATVLRGIEGFAALSEIHTSHIFALGEHLPILIVIVDERERIQTFLADLDEVLCKGVALLDDVEVIRYQPEPRQRESRRSR